VGSDGQASGFHGALHGTGKRHRNRFLSETFAQASSLVASDIGEKNVNGAGEAIFGAQLGGAVADEVDARGHARILLQKKEARDLLACEAVLWSVASHRRESHRLFAPL